MQGEREGLLVQKLLYLLRVVQPNELSQTVLHIYLFICH